VSRVWLHPKWVCRFQEYMESGCWIKMQTESRKLWPCLLRLVTNCWQQLNDEFNSKKKEYFDLRWFYSDKLTCVPYHSSLHIIYLYTKFRSI
jgi:hypothetical protein